MRGKSFVDGIRTSIKGLTEETNGQTYLPWSSALALAERPILDVVTFGEGKDPYLSFFGGVVVAVEGAETRQRVWLPVLDGANRPIPIERATARDIGDTQVRCRAKAVALLNGIGMSVYAGYNASVGAFLKAIAVRPDSDLATTQPLTQTKPGSEAAYVDWTAAYTAAKLTDPDFFFEVLMFEDVDENGEPKAIPAKRMPVGWQIAVRVNYKGEATTEWLPIMGFLEVKTKNGLKNLDHQPLPNPTVHDWNRAVMRCMTKGVATLTGYGLSVYAKENLEDLHREPTRPTQKALEPTPEEHEKLLGRFRNIRAMESLKMAREHAKQTWPGSQALIEYLRLLDEKEAELQVNLDQAA